MKEFSQEEMDGMEQDNCYHELDVHFHPERAEHGSNCVQTQKASLVGCGPTPTSVLLRHLIKVVWVYELQSRKLVWRHSLK